jgi:hypothetical protein
MGDNGQKRLNKIKRHFPGNCFSRWCRKAK